MTHKSPTVNSEGKFFYDDGSEWDPYIEYDVEGVHKKWPDETRMVCELLLNEVLFCNSRHYLTDSYSPPRTNEVSEHATLVLFVICNDIFAWACADAEEVSMRELPDLYEMWKIDKHWGSVKWCALKRKQRPQEPVIKAMKNAGSWDQQMETL